MPHFLETLLSICRFNAKPQDLPARSDLLVKVILITLALFLIRNFYLIGGAKAVAISVTQVLLIGGSLKILLGIFNQKERWLQSAIAIYGCWSVLLVLVLPMFLLNPNIDLTAPDMDATVILFLAITLWNFAVIVRVLKETLEVSTSLAILVNFVLELVFSMVLLVLFRGEMM